jgi:hypothetical protein
MRAAQSLLPDVVSANVIGFKYSSFSSDKRYEAKDD